MWCTRFRLSAAEGPFEGTLALSTRMLVPRKALTVMRKLLEGENETVEIGFGEGSIRLSRPDQTFWFRLIVDVHIADLRGQLKRHTLSLEQLIEAAGAIPAPTLNQGRP